LSQINELHADFGGCQNISRLVGSEGISFPSTVLRNSHNGAGATDEDFQSGLEVDVTETGMRTSTPNVYIVDDDAVIRDALDDMLTSAGMRVVTCRSAAEYLAMPKPDVPACLILDVRLPGMSGIDLQRQLGTEDHPPIIFLTGDSDIPTSVRAIKAGAVDFLIKPCRKADLMDAIDAAIAQDQRVRRERVERAQLRQCHSRLTPREREVLPLVVGGFLNKQAAAQLGISETTLQLHRSRVMRKMKADSLAQLVRMAGALSVPLPRTYSH
jgi:FixJ family two-component response regulator